MIKMIFFAITIGCILGAIVGFLLPMLWFGLIYVLSSNLKTKDEISDVFELPLLGSLSTEPAKKRLFSLN